MAFNADVVDSAKMTPSSLYSSSSSTCDSCSSPAPATSSVDTSTCSSVSVSSAPPMSSPLTNPLVVAGLVPVELADILAEPPADAAVAKKRTGRIVGARELTANDYANMVRDSERKKGRSIGTEAKKKGGERTKEEGKRG